MNRSLVAVLSFSFNVMLITRDAFQMLLLRQINLLKYDSVSCVFAIFFTSCPIFLEFKGDW